MATPKKKNPRQVQADKAKQIRYTVISRMAKALQKEYSLIQNFKLGYRNKEDVSTLPPYTLVVGSQNVLTNTAEQITVRNGYQLDGAAATQSTYGIDSGFDFNTHVNGIQNLRKWGANLQARYTNPITHAVSWVTILSTLVITNVVNFTEFWETTKNVCLFVNGNLNVYRWTGAVGSYLSSTVNSITLSGTKSLSNLNFDSTGSLLINGITYTYTGAGSSSSTPYAQTPTTTLVPITISDRISQIFTTGVNAQFISTMTARVNSSGTSSTSANVIIELHTDNAGVPGVGIGTAITSIPGSYAAGDFDLTFTFTQAVSPATNYHIVLYTQGVNLRAYTGVAGGVGTNISADSGVTWSARNGYLYATVNELDTSQQTFTGVTPDPTGAGISVGDAVVQLPTIGTASIKNALLTEIDLISTFRNQVYYGSFLDQTVYITKVNSYTDASFATPRVVGEGANVTLDAPPTAFIAQSDGEYISAGRAFWYRTKFTLSSDLAKESFEIDRLKTSSSQSAVAQAYTTKYKNSIVYISYESIFNALGPVKNILGDPQVVNMSDSIKNDMGAYTFTGGSIHYINYNLYFSCPRNNVVRIYNINNKYWEAPQTMPVGIFYEVNGLLYGHDANSDQSYQLFVPNLYRDNETPINAIAAFPYVSASGAQSNQLKFFNKHYTEGYIAGNTTLTLQFNYDFGAFSGSYSVGISGADRRIVFNKLTDGSLGTDTLGTQPVGTILNLPNQPTIPKFRIVNTFPPTNSYEVQTIYSSYALDANWAILRFGPAIGPARDTQAGIQE